MESQAMTTSRANMPSRNPPSRRAALSTWLVKYRTRSIIIVRRNCCQPGIAERRRQGGRGSWAGPICGRIGFAVGQGGFSLTATLSPDGHWTRADFITYDFRHSLRRVF